MSRGRRSKATLDFDRLHYVDGRDQPVTTYTAVTEWFLHYHVYGLAADSATNIDVCLQMNGLFLGGDTSRSWRWLKLPIGRIKEILCQPDAVELLETEWAIQQIKGE